LLQTEEAARRSLVTDTREGELPVQAYELFNSTELLGRMGMERMLAGLSTQALKFAITSSRRGLSTGRAPSKATTYSQLADKRFEHRLLLGRQSSRCSSIGSST